MPKMKAGYLTELGSLISQKGLSITFVIENSGINRNRLVYLRTQPKAILSLEEAQALAPVFGMSLDSFAAKLAELKKDNGDAR